FRPLVAWADKFRFEQTSSADAPESWFLFLLRRARLIQTIGEPVGRLFGSVTRMKFLSAVPAMEDPDEREPSVSRGLDMAWYGLVTLLAAFARWQVVTFVGTEVRVSELGTVFLYGLYTLIRVVLFIAIACEIWVPLGVMIGLRPALAEKIQPLA